MENSNKAGAPPLKALVPPGKRFSILATPMEKDIRTWDAKLHAEEQEQLLIILQRGEIKNVNPPP
jgi:hypothetical protein